LFSRTMAKHAGTNMRDEDFRGHDVFYCKKTGLKVVLEVQQGIQVLPTLPFDARSFRANDSVKAHIAAIQTLEPHHQSSSLTK